MSEDFIRELDGKLAEVLPDDLEDISETTPQKRKEEMIDLLQYAAEELGRSPSIRQFNSLDLKTSGYAIEEAFGTWNDAKREAGLETYEMGEGRRATTSINEKYFKKIDSSEKAYWLGTLFATSTIQSEPNRQLGLNRVSEKRYFIDGLSQAVESDYAISSFQVTQRDGQERERVQLVISNPTFIDNLLSNGYSGPEQDVESFPDLEKKFRPPFARGYLESNGHFSNGWGVKFGSREPAETLQSWFNAFGAERPTIGESYGDPVTRVSNTFDVKAIFETCWPDVLDTEPSFTPYPDRILGFLQSEYPYPENLEYLE